MRAYVTVTIALLLTASAARAQSPSEPSLAFTITGGLTTGFNLWHVDNQPLLAPGGPPPVFDTVSVGRRVRPGIVASLGVTLYRSPHFGLNGEVGYIGLGGEQQCSKPGAYVPDAQQLNQQACNNANGLHKPSSIIAFLAGGTYRFLDSVKVRPYIRVNAGLGLISNSFVETTGVVHHTSCNPISPSDNICPYTFVSERKRPGATWMVSLAGGFAYYLSPGYRVRMEGRDIITTLPVVTGPAANTATGNFADTKMTLRHIPTFTIGLDVLLEQRHTRRY